MSCDCDRYVSFRCSLNSMSYTITDLLNCRNCYRSKSTKTFVLCERPKRHRSYPLPVPSSTSQCFHEVPPTRPMKQWSTQIVTSKDRRQRTWKNTTPTQTIPITTEGITNTSDPSANQFHLRRCFLCSISLLKILSLLERPMVNKSSTVFRWGPRWQKGGQYLNWIIKRTNLNFHQVLHMANVSAQVYY